MAIVQEHFMVGEHDFIRTYSDRGTMIHGGRPEADYAEACDPAELGRTYTETEIPCDPVDPEEALSILLGGEEV
jgi:hypothetical protein